jgi:hypothetical protein
VKVPQQAVAVLVAAVAALSLSGCGSASPGVASTVGDTTVTTSDVDRLTSGYCAAFEDQFKAAGQIFPLRIIRAYVAGQMTMQAATEQFAADNGVALPASYTDEVKQLEEQLSGLPEANRDSVLEVEKAAAYVRAIETEVGGQLLADEGQTDADDEAKLSRGKEALDVWLADNPATVNPRYGIQITNGDFTDAETGTSYPLSANAVSANKSQPDQAYAATLPSSQRCG